MAYELGLISGMGNDLFVPDRYATREQAAVMLSCQATSCTLLRQKMRPWSWSLPGEEAEDLSGYQTVILMAGTLTGGQNPGWL